MVEGFLNLLRNADIVTMMVDTTGAVYWRVLLLCPFTAVII